MKDHKIIYILAFHFMACATSAFAADEKKNEDDKGVFNVIVENDSFAGSDRDYTNGVRFSWVSSEDNMPAWVQKTANALPLATNGNKRITIAAGQSMFAPQDLTRRDYIAGDHPYAGWLYGSVGMVSDTGKTLDNVMLTLGVVGPMSLAEQTQIFVHKVTGSTHPEGWDNQLENEPGVVLTYERKWRGLYEIEPFGIGADVIPHIGVNLGNVNTDASIGATFRLGYDLPTDYGPPRIRPSLSGSDFFTPTEDLGGYLFATVAERAVGRNIFLDGNSFQDGPHVNKEFFVSSLQVGGVLTWGETRLSYTQVFMTKEYTAQKHASSFGALTLSQRF